MKRKLLLLRQKTSPGKVRTNILYLFQTPLHHFLLYMPGHHVNKPNVMFVLKEVRDFMRCAEAMMMPEDLTVEVLNGEREEIVEKLSSFWLDTGQSWNTLEHVLTQCQELASADLAHMMEHYNRKGNSLLHFLSYCGLILPCIVCRCSFDN